MPRVSEIDTDRGEPALQPIFMRSRMNIALGVAAQGFCVLDMAPQTAAGAAR